VHKIESVEPAKQAERQVSLCAGMSSKGETYFARAHRGGVLAKSLEGFRRQTAALEQGKSEVFV
jgi:hypothetical protein